MAGGSLAVSAPAGAATTAKTADSFVESIGVNIHSEYTDTPYYNQFETVKERLEELGVRHVRDHLKPAPPGQHEALNELAQIGVKSTLILGEPSNGLSGLDELVSDVETELSSATEAVEGPNEWSTSGDSEWKSHLIAYQERLYGDVKESPSLSHLPVIGPSIVHGDQEELGDISAFLDYGNIHSYPEANPPEYRMGLNVERAELNSGSKPIMATETGYTNALNWTPVGPGENKPISEDGAAVYMPRLFFEYFIRHLARTFSYELVDARPDPGLEDRERHFGLLRNDLSEKPAFVALRNMIEILEDPGPAFTPGPLSYSLSGEGATLHTALLQKRDGTFYLALWRLESIWDPDKKEALDAPSDPVTVHVEPEMQSYAVYTPSLSSEPISSVEHPTESVTVDVGPEVVILELKPASSTPEQPTPGTVAQTVLASPAITSVVPEGERLAPHCIVPSLKGRKLKAAKTKVRSADCKVGKIAKGNGATAKTGKVVKQEPKPGRMLPPGTRVAMTLGPAA
jgi:PASTA domain